MIFLSATVSSKTFSDTDESASIRTLSAVIEGRAGFEEVGSFWELSGSMDETFQVSVCILLCDFNCCLLSRIL